MNRPAVLADIVRNGSSQWPDRRAIVSDERTVTYAELDRRSNQVANALAARGIGHGDRVGFLSMNRIEYFETMLGAAKLGAVTVPVNWRLAPGEVGAVLDDADPSVLVVEGDLLALVAGAPDRLADRIVVVGAHPDGDGRSSFDTLVDAAADDDPLVDVVDTDVMWQLYTSGTTGRPKGVMLMHRNLLLTADGLADAWHFDPGCVVYVPYPSFHAVGTAWPILTMSRGGTVLLRRAFDPADFLHHVDTEGVTLTMMVPAVLNMVLDEADGSDADLSSLRDIVYGAAPISQAVLARAIELMPGCEFHHAYGLTESTGTVTTMQWHEHRVGEERMKSCGRALPWVEMKLVDPNDGREVEVREVGEVWMRGTTVMKGYHGKPDETADTITDGWLHTGDAGYLDEDGYLYLTDRVKDMIISGGENIYPAEVENVLFEHPAVREAAVVGIPHERWGETVLAVVVPRPGAVVEPDEVISFCRERLAHYKCPTRVEVRDEPLPLNPTGKVLRRELRTIYDGS
ncbi:MAG: long-chain-fatty-acid--CoA ligase [Ilumatobacter fluminis]|uniref:long-chain-fatty-acid--CoA ligase n=1 Tax=Ilumatobacter fluminis TaxID=467091 RepID=UPI0032EBA5BE